MDDSLHQPHDKLFTATFGVPENTAAFLKPLLPPAIAGSLDWAALRLLPGRFVDGKYQSTHTDLLFSVPLAGSETLLYLLFEHQSTRDPTLSLRLLRYLVRIWEDCLRARPGRSLPAILPVVLSQNADGWAPVPSLLEMLDLSGDFREAIRPYVPDFAHFHLQLAEMGFDEIPGTPSGVYVLRAMKAERLGCLLDAAVWEEEVLMEVPRELFQMVLRYILGADIDRDAFEDRVKTLRDPKVRADAMTLAQVYHQKGHQEGRQEGRRSSILKALALRFGEVPEGLRVAVATEADLDRLDQLVDLAITAPDLESFVAAL